MASSWQQSGSTLDVDRSTASATSPLREEVVAGPEGSGYMSDDSNARNLTRGASRKLNKTLNKLNPFKVLPSRCLSCGLWFLADFCILEYLQAVLTVIVDVMRTATSSDSWRTMV